MLQGGIGSARSLAGARYGGISTIDDAGRDKDYVTSGMTPEEHRGLEETPDGERVVCELRAWRMVMCLFFLWMLNPNPPNDGVWEAC